MGKNATDKFLIGSSFTLIMAFPLIFIVVLVVVMCVLAVGFFLWGLKKAIKLLINSAIGFFALWLTKVILIKTLVINIWSVLIVAIGGIIGYFVVIILHFFGVF